MKVKPCATEDIHDLDYTVGSTHLLKKLISGQWDEQFLVAQPGHKIAHKDFFE